MWLYELTKVWRYYFVYLLPANWTNKNALIMIAFSAFPPSSNKFNTIIYNMNNYNTLFC